MWNEIKRKERASPVWHPLGGLLEGSSALVLMEFRMCRAFAVACM